MRQILRRVTREPSGLHHATAGGRGRLLILASEIIGTKAAAQGFERSQRLALGVQDIARALVMDARAERAFDHIGLVFFRELAEMTPVDANEVHAA